MSTPPTTGRRHGHPVSPAACAAHRQPNPLCHGQPTSSTAAALFRRTHGVNRRAQEFTRNTPVQKLPAQDAELCVQPKDELVQSVCVLALNIIAAPALLSLQVCDEEYVSAGTKSSADQHRTFERLQHYRFQLLGHAGLRERYGSGIQNMTCSTKKKSPFWRGKVQVDELKAPCEVLFLYSR